MRESNICLPFAIGYTTTNYFKSTWQSFVKVLGYESMRHWSNKVLAIALVPVESVHFISVALVKGQNERDALVPKVKILPKSLAFREILRDDRIDPWFVSRPHLTFNGQVVAAFELGFEVGHCALANEMALGRKMVERLLLK